MNRWIAVLSVLLFTMGIGCQGGTDLSSQGPRIGFVMKTLNNPFFIQMHEGAQEAAERLGVQLVVQAAEREIDVERQMQIVENLIVSRVDALCITPSGSREIVAAIQKANQAGIPVLIVDTRIDESTAAAMGVEIATFIGSDNYQGGYLAGEYLVQQFGEETAIAILEGIPGHETHDSRLQGFLDAIQESDHIQLAASQPANTERDQGYNVFQNILQTAPHVRALFATNDMMALGAVEAIAAAGREGQIAVIGFDAIDEARQSIQAGRMAASIAQNPYEMGRIAVEQAYAVISGNVIPEEIAVPIELITRDSMQSH